MIETRKSSKRNHLSTAAVQTSVIQSEDAPDHYSVSSTTNDPSRYNPTPSDSSARTIEPALHLESKQGMRTLRDFIVLLSF